ncbi:probable methyltransferase PMT2 [Dioscorea cayenensis subsp. rotundata]|uniref:Methyltransferase n=1 Tax=Dioscorea cayennensis subsp. rotundata TaxID=55577 RepID=A0AB40C5L3_DIOCR|nr:probable methyltransferase PMT2 [Dioscorea cayenensis subsp. rotundata]XP_039134913.1 probable methyltransferase PMT2 [Dioscorea cayenensis subsp. rotundata]
MNLLDGRTTRSLLSIMIILSLCFFFYILTIWHINNNGNREFGKSDRIALKITEETECSVLSNLKFETHHKLKSGLNLPELKTQVLESCDSQYTDYTPCQDQKRAMTLPMENMVYRERHCPQENEKLHCLIPAPKDYITPFPWPKSRDYVPYGNVPYKSSTIGKPFENWVQLKGNLFSFPGGGSTFPQADAYIEELASVIPLADGSIRTALDTGCGVASWGAYLLKRKIITMSFAPRDSHGAHVQLALERGVPAVIGVLGTIKLPYPSRAFDMVHCSECMIPWTSNDGMYMMEVDRILRPGGYWILSGTPINWKENYQAWNRSMHELQEEQRKIEELASVLCWEKKYEKGNLAIWMKTNSSPCRRPEVLSVKMCKSKEDDDVWYKSIQPCVTPSLQVNRPDEISSRQLKKFPDRLFAVPPRISERYIQGVSVEAYVENNNLWKKNVKTYKRINKLIGSVRYRNIMDMNAGLGGFAAALESPQLWVMNVVPTISERNTLGVVYERGLIGIYHDWCEAFSTYPRTYDMIHADAVFSLYQNRCKMEDILLEMDRILRPEGMIIIRDDVDIVNQIRRLANSMRWNTRLLDHEDGPLVPEKVLIAVKKDLVGNETTVFLTSKVTTCHQTRVFGGAS